jgi:hypothetical protein
MYLYRHKNTTDIAFEILTSLYNHANDTIEFTVIWWNVGKCHTPTCMNIVEDLKLKKDVFESDWIRYELKNGRLYAESDK